MADAEQLQREIGERVRAAREKAGLSVARLAAELGIHRSVMARIEAGEVSLSTTRAVQIAQITRTRVGRLLEGAAR